jgi:hypothetical protein
MVDCLLDLALRPGEHDLPPVQVLLTAVASVATLLGGDAPGEIDGHVVPAEMLRQLLRGLTGHHPERDRRAATTDPTAATGAENATAVGSDVPWQVIEQDELERWWSEVERRVLADALDGEPERAPDPTPASDPT